MKRFTSVLVANRGEIACRVIHSAREQGYRTIAVYSDADAGAPHVQLADDSVCIGPGPVNESYLVVQNILDAAASSGAGAVHPGYGFLSENAGFARACEEAGLVFIGPSPEAIHLMGNKAEAKRRMIQAGVPCVPGYEGNDQSDDALLSAAQKIGLPLMVKAAAGGGGRGMRLVSSHDEMLNAIRLARAATGRSKIVRFASHYHGWHDHSASGYAAQFDGAPATGILPEITNNTLLLRPGDSAQLSKAVEEFGHEIAGFIIEPVGTHFGVVPLDPDFLHQVQKAARQTGAVFILDEVLSGFRIAPGGAQSFYGLSPDLTTLAKILCGGMPGGAVAGRADILDLMAADEARRAGRPKVLHQGTFTANPVSMAAGLATIAQLERTNACEKVNTLGALARKRLNETARAESLPFSFYGEFSIFHVLFDANPPTDMRYEDYLARPQPLTNRFRMALNVLGIDVNTRGSGLLSAAHEEADIDTLCDALVEAGHMLRRENLLPQ